MLILSRKIGERLCIGDNVVVTVIEVKGDQVKLGVEAPREVKVFREEVYEQVVKENKLASASVCEDKLKDIALLITPS